MSRFTSPLDSDSENTHISLPHRITSGSHHHPLRPTNRPIRNPPRRQRHGTQRHLDDLKHRAHSRHVDLQAVREDLCIFL
jgi:hypothetical protein